MCFCVCSCEYTTIAELPLQSIIPRPHVEDRSCPEPTLTYLLGTVGLEVRGAQPCVTPDVPPALQPPPLNSTPPAASLHHSPCPLISPWTVVSPLHRVSKGDLHQMSACRKPSLTRVGEWGNGDEVFENL